MLLHCNESNELEKRQLNNRINHIHEKALRIVYKGAMSDFNTLLKKDSSVTILQTTANDRIYRKNLGVNPCFMKSRC